METRSTPWCVRFDRRLADASGFLDVDGQDADRLGRRTIRAVVCAALRGNGIHDVHPLGHLAEDGVATSLRRELGVLVDDEPLAAVGVGVTSPSHGQRSTGVVAV